MSTSPADRVLALAAAVVGMAALTAVVQSRNTAPVISALWEGFAGIISGILATMTGSRAGAAAGDLYNN